MSEAAQLLYKLKGVFPKSRSSSKNEQSEFPSKIQLTNAIFRLHSHVAFFFLLSSSLLIFVQQLMGVHIKCLMPSSEEGSQDLRTSAVTTVRTKQNCRYKLQKCETLSIFGTNFLL